VSEESYGTGPIVGREITLDGGRKVFLGRREGTDKAFLRFFNPDNKSPYKFLCLSAEAEKAMIMLLMDDGVGEPEEVETRKPDPEDGPDAICRVMVPITAKLDEAGTWVAEVPLETVDGEE
jgi:hypothetical protein